MTGWMLSTNRVSSFGPTSCSQLNWKGTLTRSEIGLASFRQLRLLVRRGRLRRAGLLRVHHHRARRDAEQPSNDRTPSHCRIMCPPLKPTTDGASFIRSRSAAR